MITEVPCNSNLNHKPYINPKTKPRPKARHLGDRGDAVRDVRELDSLLGGQIALAHIGSRVQQQGHTRKQRGYGDLWGCMGLYGV